MNRDYFTSPQQGGSRSSHDYGRTHLPLERPSLWRSVINSLFGGRNAG